MTAITEGERERIFEFCQKYLPTPFLRKKLPWVLFKISIRSFPKQKFAIQREYMLSNANTCYPYVLSDVNNICNRREYMLSKMKKVLYNATNVLANVITCYSMRERVIQCKNLFIPCKNVKSNMKRCYSMQEM